MLYYLLTLLEKLYHPPGFGVVKYLTFRSAAAAVTALIISFWIGPKIIRMLKRHQIGEAAKLEAPKSHLSKAGTPTMGGLIVLGSVLIPTLLWGDLKNLYVILILIVTAGLGVVGFLDDYLKVVKKKPKGLIGWYKIVGQVVIGLVLGLALYYSTDLKLINANTITTVPFFKNLEFDFGFLYVPMVIFIIMATSNGVNLTDGLDGLAIGTVGIVALTLAVISYISGNIEFSKYLNIIYLKGNGELVITAPHSSVQHSDFSGTIPIQRRSLWGTQDRLPLAEPSVP
jgi:phospho-N-acetylmuramoyl-pentapeptide-transferase